jgi:hypothetical protein
MTEPRLDSIMAFESTKTQKYYPNYVFCQNCRKSTNSTYPMILQRYNQNKLYFLSRCSECGFIKPTHYLRKINLPDLVNKRAFEIPMKHMYLDYVEGIPIMDLLKV